MDNYLYIPYIILHRRGLIDLENVLKTTEDICNYYDKERINYDYNVYIGEYYVKIVYVIW